MDESSERSTLVKNIMNHEQIFKINGNSAQVIFNQLSLEEKVTIVLGTPWEKRQTLILLAEKPEELIQALPEEELYWTIKETGIADALPIIARTSYEQFQYFIDIDCWKKDRIDMKQMIIWLQLMLRCNESKVLEWLGKTDEQFLNYIFRQLFTISKISEDVDLAEASDKLPQWTLDGIYYFKFADEDARLVSIPFLHLLYKTASKLFYYVIENTIWSFDAELEEDLFRLRQSRVAEKGFPSLDEALQIYQHIRPEHMQTFLKEQGLSGNATAEAKVVHPGLRYGIGTEKPAQFLRDILTMIDRKKILDRIQSEIVHITNQIMIADGLEVRETQDLRKSLHKSVGYVNIGLEVLSKHNIGEAIRIMEKVPIPFLFRTGYSQVLDLKNRLHQIHSGVWQNYRQFLPLYFDSPWGETIDGLSRTRPVYFAGNSIAGGFIFRDFETLAEILVTGQVLDIVAIAEKVLFGVLGIDIHNLMQTVISSTNLTDSIEVRARSLFLTILVHHILYSKTEFAPVTETDLKKFFAAVFIKSESPNETGLHLKNELCHETITWIRNQYEPEGKEAVTALEVFVKSCFKLLQDECASVAGRDHIDTRYITSFIFKK